jgi:hypothetical protein
MKSKIPIVALLTLFMFGCSKDYKKEHDALKQQLESANISLDSCLKNQTSLAKNIFSINPYVPKQRIRKMNQGEGTNLINLKPHKELNTIDNKYENINLQIPVTNEFLKIVDVVNISSNNINAILVLVNGNEGDPTCGQPLTHFITSNLKVAKIDGLRITNSNKKLLVIVFHDDEFYSNNETANFVQYVKNCSDYEKCASDIMSQPPLCDKKYMLDKDGNAIFLPREKGADILN